ncbi:MAG TPA: nitrogen fixation protein NifH [Anaerolineae bacterium]|nr:nitrogen fixation protein NifH [Anaerolineae bacterium]
MSWQGQLKGDALSWLLEPDCPGVRYLALRDLLDRPGDDADLLAARQEAHDRGPIAAILAAMEGDGYWVEPGAGYYPKYRGTVWSIITLAQLGASPDVDVRVGRACAYLLDQALLPGGQFGIGGTPSSTADCLQGNLCHALLALGCDAERLEPAFEWMARTTTGEGLAPNTDRHATMRYYASKCGPLFACGANNKLPCAWGGVKVMLAFGRWPAGRRTPLVERAIGQGVDWFLGIDPATAAYPSGWTSKPSGNWWKFGFPVFYVTDLLQLVEALLALGHGPDPRLANAVALIRDKQDAQGRWALEYDYAGKTWVDFGRKRQPNKWVTLRALRLLKAAGTPGVGAAEAA